MASASSEMLMEDLQGLKIDEVDMWNAAEELDSGDEWVSQYHDVQDDSNISHSEQAGQAPHQHTSCLDGLPSFEKTFIQALGCRRKETQEEQKKNGDATWCTFLARLSQRHVPKENSMTSELWNSVMGIPVLALTICVFGGPRAASRLLLVSKTTNASESSQLWEYFARCLYTESSLDLHWATSRSPARPSCMPRLSFFAKRKSKGMVHDYQTYKRLVLDENRQNVWKCIGIWHMPQWCRRCDIGPGGTFVGLGRKKYGTVLSCSIDLVNLTICLHIHGWYEYPDESKLDVAENSGLYKYVPSSLVSLESRFEASIAPCEVVIHQHSYEEYNALIKFPIVISKPPLYRGEFSRTKQDRVAKFWEAGAIYKFSFGSLAPNRAKYEPTELFQLMGSSRAKKQLSEPSLNTRAKRALEAKDPFGPKLVTEHFERQAWRKIERDAFLVKFPGYIVGSEYYDHYTFNHCRRDGWLYSRPLPW